MKENGRDNMNPLQKQIAKALFFFFATIILLTMFLATVVQGILLHLQGMSAEAVPYYFIAMTSFASALWIYTRGRIILRNF